MICSMCNQFFMVPIIYGYPSPQLIDAARKDEIVLGGPSRKEYTHYCLHCNEPQIVDISLEF